MSQPVYLNIGCGERHLPGFINVDTLETADVVCDVTKGLPFDDGSVDAIIHEHFIEHVSLAEGVRFLMECRRVLKPGGITRIATPDLEAIVEDYGRDAFLHEDWHTFGYDWVQTRAEMLNLSMREWGHRWLYDEEELRRIAALTGFEAPVRCARGESQHEHLIGLEYRAGSRLVLELRKPDRRPSTADTPRVSILIACYKPEFFRETLESALAQDYPSFEVVVTDDDPTGACEAIVRSFDDSRLRYFRNSERLGGVRNHLEAFARAEGEYVKFLSDDDVLATDCVRKLAACLLRQPNATVATSHRQRIDAAGVALDDIEATKRIVGEPSVIRGVRALQKLIGEQLNYIGEPSTAMFRRADLAGTTPHIFAVAGVETRSNIDVSMWCTLLAKGDLVYLPETLSYFRIHDAQDQHDPVMKEHGRNAWEWIRRVGLHLGLWVAGVGAELLPRPLYPIPWWTERTSEAVRHVIQALEKGDVASARAAIEACADEDLSDPTVGLLITELDGEHAGVQATIARLAELLRGREWFLPAQMRLIQFLRDGDEHALAEDILEALHALVPVLSLGDGFEKDGAHWWLHPEATLLQPGGCAPLRLLLGLRRPLSISALSVAVRLECDEQPLGEWVWAPDGTVDEIVEIELPPSQSSRRVRLRWDVTRPPFSELGAKPVLELTHFEVGLVAPEAQRASA